MVGGNEHTDVLDFSPWNGHTQPQQGRARGGGGTDARPIPGMKIRTKANVQAESFRPSMAVMSQGLEIKADPPHRLGLIAQPLRVGLAEFKYLSKKDKGGRNVPETLAEEKRGSLRLGKRKRWEPT